MQRNAGNVEQNGPVLHGLFVNRRWVISMGYNPDKPYVDCQPHVKICDENGRIDELSMATVFVKSTKHAETFDMVAFHRVINNQLDVKMYCNMPLSAISKVSIPETCAI